MAINKTQNGISVTKVMVMRSVKQKTTSVCKNGV